MVHALQQVRLAPQPLPRIATAGSPTRIELLAVGNKPRRCPAQRAEVGKGAQCSANCVVHSIDQALQAISKGPCPHFGRGGFLFIILPLKLPFIKAERIPIRSIKVGIGTKNIVIGILARQRTSILQG